MITRRCSERRFFLRPEAAVNEAFLYCLAEAAARFDIDVLFTVANSNHHHTGIRDRRGNYPAFLAHFHKLVAKCGNALRGRWENFWAPEQASVVELVDPADALDKLVYALSNPVKDQLVERAVDWPGASALAAILADAPVTTARPRCFFREAGPMPTSATLRFARPPGFEVLSHAEWTALIRRRMAEVEAIAAAERRRTGRRVLGRRAVLAQSWRDRPRSHEPRRNISPRVAAKSKWSRIEALLRNRAFLDAYRAARAALVAGVRDVLFPAGTYWLPRLSPATCRTCSTA